jgi:hypothetical protein
METTWLDLRPIRPGEGREVVSVVGRGGESSCVNLGGKRSKIKMKIKSKKRIKRKSRSKIKTDSTGPRLGSYS